MENITELQTPSTETSYSAALKGAEEKLNSTLQQTQDFLDKQTFCPTFLLDFH